MTIKNNEIVFPDDGGGATHGIISASSASVSDLNDILAGRTVAFIPTTANVPEANYGICMTIGTDAWRWQIAFMIDNKVYLRSKINTSNPWGSWTQFTLT